MGLGLGLGLGLRWGLGLGLGLELGLGPAHPFVGLVLIEALVCEVLGHPTHDDGEDTVLPVLAQSHISIQLVARHSLCGVGGWGMGLGVGVRS